jgi:mediator of RNA polymerase II transcription subunit 5
MPASINLTVQSWAKFFSRSLATRLDPETFTSFVQIISAKHPLSPAHICDIFLRPIPDNDSSPDPRVPQYLQAMLGLGVITIPVILKTLLRYSTFGWQSDEGEGKPKGGDSPKWTNSYSTEEILLYRMAKAVSTGTSPKTSQEAVELLLVAIHWMDIVAKVGQAANEILSLSGNNHVAEIAATTMALGTLVVAMVDNQQVLKVLSQGSAPKGTVKKLSTTLANFLPILMQSSPQIATRLDAFRMQTLQTLITIEPVDKKEIAASKEIDEMLGGSIELGIDDLIISDLPSMNSRSGLYIYLNSLVSIPSHVAKYTC